MAPITLIPYPIEEEENEMDFLKRLETWWMRRSGKMCAIPPCTGVINKEKPGFPVSLVALPDNEVPNKGAACGECYISRNPVND